MSSDDRRDDARAPSPDRRPEDETTRSAAIEDAASGALVGPYRLVRRIGEGGMGTVWLAEQVEPIRREVALKLVKVGMDTREVVARFEAERQMLAILDHPGIARVFDAGATTSGRPYFAMEYVRGIPITEYCDRHRLTTAERVDLMCKVCEAIQHAHQKGVIHRDIKPTNVLVTLADASVPTPKVIDFGVARATSELATDATMYTRHGGWVGTPSYMSPEQADPSGLDLDTRTDIYALGVVLYELLTGALPFEAERLRSAGVGEMQRILREEEPPTPSRRLSRLATAEEAASIRRTDVRGLHRALAGDLDWITLKALEKDRARRYDSASELAADLRRYRNHEPVTARPPSASYRLGKLVRRNRLATAFAATVATLVVVLGVTMTIQANRVARARDEARREAAASTRVAEFLADTLASVDPEALGRGLADDLRERIVRAAAARGRSADGADAGTALDRLLEGVNVTDAGLRMLDDHVLARASVTVEQRFADDPDIAARLDGTLGETYKRLGMYAQAEDGLRRALDTLRRAHGDDHPDVLVAEGALANLLLWRGRYDEAAEAYEGILARMEPVVGREHPATLACRQGLGNAYQLQGRLDEAEGVFRATLAGRRDVLGARHQDTVQSQVDLASLLSERGALAEAQELLREAVDIRRRQLGGEHPYTLWATAALATTLRDDGQLDEAESLFAAVLAARRRLLGDEHPFTLWSTAALANTYARQDRLGEAETLHREVLAVRRRVHGPSHPLTLASQANLAFCLYRQDRLDEAEALYAATVAEQARVLGDDHPATLDTRNQLGSVIFRAGRVDEAVALFEHTLAESERVAGRLHPSTLDVLHNLGVGLLDAGRADAARAVLVDLLARRRERAETVSDAAAKLSYAALALDCALEDLRDPEAAVRFALAANERTGYRRVAYVVLLARAYDRVGDRAAARRTIEEAIARLAPEQGDRRATLQAQLARYD